MGRPRKDPNREDTRTRLLKAAEVAFGAHGFARARLADIAKTGGVSRPSLLHHFGSKRGLYEAVVARGFADLRREVERVSTIEDLPALLDALTGRLIAFADARPGVPALVVRELIDRGDDGSTDVIEAEMVPLVAHLEALVRTRSAPVLEAFPVRDAIVAVMIAHMVKVASGPSPLWSDGTTPTLTRALFAGAAGLTEDT